MSKTQLIARRGDVLYEITPQEMAFRNSLGCDQYIPVTEITGKSGRAMLRGRSVRVAIGANDREYAVFSDGSAVEF